jgi:hypothetical protein
VWLLGAVLLLATCGPFERSMQSAAAASAARATRPVTARSGPTSVRLTVDRSHGRTGAVFGFAVSVTVRGPRGALAYRLTFGDGTSSNPAVPLVCLSTPRPSATGTWVVHHRYLHPGTYRVVATGWAECTPGRASATATVTVG